jgi:hypothetical protein
MSRAQLTSTVEQNSAGAAAPFSAGKNKVINGDFGVWQRGTSFALASTSAYTCDRYIGDAGSMSYTFSRQTFTAGTAPVAGYEGTYFYRALAVSGSGGFPKIQQKIIHNVVETKPVVEIKEEITTKTKFVKPSTKIVVQDEEVQY